MNPRTIGIVIGLIMMVRVMVQCSSALWRNAGLRTRTVRRSIQRKRRRALSYIRGRVECIGALSVRLLTATHAAIQAPECEGHRAA